MPDDHRRGRRVGLRPAGPLTDAHYRGLADCRCRAFPAIHARVMCDPALPRVVAAPPTPPTRPAGGGG